jgi:hypothetical protein
VTRALLITAALLVALGLAYAKGRGDGVDQMQAAQDAATVKALAERDALALDLIAAERKRLTAENDRRVMAQDLEDQANAEPVLVPECLSTGRVRRLNLQ